MRAAERIYSARKQIHSQCWAKGPRAARRVAPLHKSVQSNKPSDSDESGQEQRKDPVKTLRIRMYEERAGQCDTVVRRTLAPSGAV